MQWKEIASTPDLHGDILVGTDEIEVIYFRKLYQ